MRRATRSSLAAGFGLWLLLGVAGGGGAGAGDPGPGRASPVPEADRISGPGATTDDSWPAVAWNGTANEYLVVWEDRRDIGTREVDIYGRRVSAAGLPVGADLRISAPGAIAEELRPAVVWNGTANEYLVVWSDTRHGSTGRGSDVYGQRVSAGGSRVGANFRVSGPGAVCDEWAPALAWNGEANEYLVVWEQQRDSGAASDIYGRRVAPDGSPAGPALLISTPAGPACAGAACYHSVPAVAWNGTADEYLVAYVDRRAYATRFSEVYGRRVSAAGAVVGAGFRINGPAGTSDDYGPKVAWNRTDDEYLVVWESWRAASNSWDVYGRRVPAAGPPLPAEFRIGGPGATTDESWPNLVWNDAADRYLVVWQDWRNSSARGIDIYGRRVAAAGAPLGLDFRISGPGATADDELPAVAWNGATGEYLVVWQDGRNLSTRGTDIYGRLVAG